MKTYWDSSALIEALHDPKLRSRIRRGENGTRPHSLAEVFSTLTKGVNFRYPPADAANMAADLAKDLDFVELSSADAVSALKKASSLGVRGARIHDLMHAEGRGQNAEGGGAKWVEHPTSSIPHPNPNTAARRKSRRKVIWISLPD